jgi:hypothetical protein
LNLILNNDLAGLSDLLAEVCPQADNAGQQQSKNEEFPMPDNHWINQTNLSELQGGSPQKGKTLLHLALERGPDMTELLLRAGAKADSYNDILGKAPIHVATELGSRQVLEILLDGKVKYYNGKIRHIYLTSYTDYSVTHQYLKKFSYGFWDNQWFGRNQIYLKLKLGALQFMPGIKNLNLNFF